MGRKGLNHKNCENILQLRLVTPILGDHESGFPPGFLVDTSAKIGIESGLLPG